MDTSTRTPAIICDVDETLCDVRGIRHYVERHAGAPKFRASFARIHSESEACPAFSDVVRLVGALDLAGYALVVVTPREARWAKLTERWLQQHGVEQAELLTRRDLDYRPDAVVKAEIRDEIMSRFYPRLAIDDREDILAVWAEALVPTVRVSEGGLLSPVRWQGLAEDAQLDALVGRARGYGRR